jgi:hypothetical protein
MLFAGFSCGEDYLKVDYYDILPGDMMFDDETNAQAGLIGCYDTFYPTKSGAATDLSMWGFKPQFMLANHPTMDTQASGWDKTYCTQDWTASSSEFEQVWIGHYAAISRCNIFLAGLETMDPSLFAGGEKTKNEMRAQALAIRAWNYLNLARNFGRIPMLQAGETYSNTPSKPRPETEDGTWDLIIEDLSTAAAVLDWTPINGNYGRITKGFCLSYQAIAKMYQGKYDEAKGLFKQVIDSGTYSLLPCYSYLFDPETAWTTEDVFAVVQWSDWGNNMGGNNGWSPQEDHYMWVLYNTASMEYNGWGSLFISWECYKSFEEGDRRRRASMVALGEANPWTGEVIGAVSAPRVKTGAEFMPNISSVKYWRRKADYYLTINTPFTLRTLRYAEVLLDYAECCFHTGDVATGWSVVNQIRQRAFGNLEVGLNDPDYAIPMLTEAVNVPDGQTYYTQYKADKGYSADPLLIAINMERRHEFNAEFSFFYDLKRSGLLDEYVEREYPKNVGVDPKVDPDAAYDDWHIWRAFDHNPNKMLFPIPEKEILTNDAIGPEDQNPGY